jgi:hypothetical protein
MNEMHLIECLNSKALKKTAIRLLISFIARGGHASRPSERSNSLAALA